MPVPYTNVTVTDRRNGPRYRNRMTVDLSRDTTFKRSTRFSHV